MATRNRLDGVKWPVTNPKVLIVEFSSEEEVSDIITSVLLWTILHTLYAVVFAAISYLLGLWYIRF